MPPTPISSTSTAGPSTSSGGSKKRSTAPKRGAIACVRCKERKAKCVPAPHGTSPVPTCTNCLAARKECVYLERTPNEIFLLEYVSQLETRCAALEMELRKINPSSHFSSDHATPLAPAEARTAAVDKLNQQYPPTSASQTQDLTAGAPHGVAGGSVDQTAADSDPDEEEDLATTIGMISLGGGEEPVYVGPSSGVNWARVCATALRRPLDRSRPSHLSRFSYLAPPDAASVQSALEYTLHHPTPPLPPPVLASHYLSVVYEHVQARYGCFDWRTVNHWHENRQSICQGRPLWGVGTGQDEIRSLAAFFLWLCYGYGARLTEDDKLEGAVSHEVYYNAAVACLSTLTSHHSLATVQALILLVIYGFRHPTAEVSVWQVGGLAMRTALELGLHRRTRSREEREKDPFRYEMKKRVFWAVYSLDRILSAQLGRPSGIQDRDIDVELPLNIAVDCTDLQPQQLAAMQTRQIEMMDGCRPGDEYTEGYGGLTSMTSALHNIRLNQLKHLIQDAIYRLDKPLRARGRDNTSPEREDIPEVDLLLSKLGKWRAYHPVPQEGVRVPLLSVDHFELEYHNCVQLLLRPIIGGRRAANRYVSLCLETAASLCETQATYLQPPVTISKLSTWRFYRLFLAGMTILHVLTTFYPTLSEHDRIRAQNAISRCQSTLSIFGSRFRGAARHEKLFRELVSACSTRIHNGDSQVPSVQGQRNSPSKIAGSQPNSTEFLMPMAPQPALQQALHPDVDSHTAWAMPQSQAMPVPFMPSSLGQSTVDNHNEGHSVNSAMPDGGIEWATMLDQLGSGMRDDIFSLLNSVKLESEPTLSSVNENAATGSSFIDPATGLLAQQLDFNLFSLSPSSGSVGTGSGGIPFDLGGFGLGVGEVVGEGIGDGGFDYGGGLAWGASLPPLGAVGFDAFDQAEIGAVTAAAGTGGGSNAGGGISEWFSAFDNSPAAGQEPDTQNINTNTAGSDSNTETGPGVSLSTGNGNGQAWNFHY